MRSPAARARVPFKRLAIEFVVSALSFWLVAAVLPGMHLNDLGSAALAAVAVALLNALLWPVIARVASRAILWTAGLLGVVLNGVILLIAEALIDGFEIDSLWAAAIASLLITFVSIAVGSLLSLDDDDVWRRQTMRRVSMSCSLPQ